MNDKLSPEITDTDIAIIGISGRFPGASNIKDLWSKLLAGEETISQLSESQLREAGIPETLFNDPDYVKAAGIIDNVKAFDAEFFGYLPNEAAIIDPQQRHILECSWNALEDAGYTPAKYEGIISVYAGVGRNAYFSKNIITHPDLLEGSADFPGMLGVEKDYVATRISYKLNLHGPAVNVQSACSTSGTAVHLACQSLINGESDIALAGGCRILVPNAAGYQFIEGGALSQDGHCRTFDSNASGMVRSNGVAVLAFKRLDDAIEDNDSIYAVIKSTAINNDGNDKVGFTAPSISGQSKVITEALELAGLNADDIVYVEAHGTGTPVGDPIEVQALTKAYRNTTEQSSFCGIGSIKSNIGHLDAAAGIAGMIKAALSIKESKIPPTINYSAPNPQINLTNSPFFVCNELLEWQSDKPLYIGTSSFGLGGTNFHSILGPAPQRPSLETNRKTHLLKLSAASANSLKQMRSQLSEYLSENTEINLADVAFTLDKGRADFKFRSTIACQSSNEAITELSSQNIATATAPLAIEDPVFLFPGGGAQYMKMSSELYANEEIFANSMNDGFSILSQLGENDHEALWLNGEPDELSLPSIQLPLIFLVEYSLYKLLSSWGIKPSALMGHSMGEVTAACVAEVISFNDAIRIIYKRGLFLESAKEGQMLSISLSADEIKPYLTPEVDLAVINAPELCVISGKESDIAKLENQLANDKIDAQRVRISTAAHSQLLDPILDEFRNEYASIALSPPKLPIISNRTGIELTDADACSPDYWASQLRNTVKFSQGVDYLIQEGHQLFLEVGPGKALTSLVQMHGAESDITIKAISSIRHTENPIDDSLFLLNAVGELWQAGMPMPLDDYYSDEQRKRISLPTYAFEKTEHWIEPSTAQIAPMSTINADTLLSSSPYQQQSATPASTVSTTPLTRIELIVQKIQNIIHDLSGIAIDDIDNDATFLELGFDSLFLTQANLRFKKAFKLKITFRHLYEDTPSISALAKFIDSSLPDEAFSEELNQSNTPTNIAIAGSSSTPLPDNLPSEYSTLLSTLRNQIQASGAIIEKLHGSNNPNNALIANNKTETTATNQKQATDSLNIQKKNRQFGAYRPLDKSSSTLSKKQAQYLQSFIDNYCSKTQQSKTLSQNQREVLSDARSISGFRKEWKEMVYQLAVEKSQGSQVWDIDGNEYIDLSGGFGINLFGFSPKFVVEAVEKQLAKGFELGNLTPLAQEAAELIKKITGMERVTFTNTGSEAVAAAVRAARTATGKEKIAVFDGEYHGMSDELLVKALETPSGLKPVPVSPGIPNFLVDNIIILDYEDPNCMAILEANADDIAGVVIEPMQSRSPSNPTHKMFPAIREVTQKHGIALIFDELITGFRLHPRGAQGYYNIDVDISCYGKVLSGGIPMSAVAGKAEFLDSFDGGEWAFGDNSFPEANVTYFGGTFSRHPLSIASSIAVLKHIDQIGMDFYKQLNARCEQLANELNTVLENNHFPAMVDSCGSVFYIKFTDDNPYSRLLYWHLRDKGILIYDRPFYLSSCHTESQLEKVISAFEKSVLELQEAELVPKNIKLHSNMDTNFIPFNEGQQEIWLATLMNAESAQAFHEQMAISIKTRLDKSTLEKALEKLIHRHQSLRASVDSDNLGLNIKETITDINIKEYDLSATNPSDVNEKINVILESNFKNPFNFNEAPLLRLCLIQTQADESILVIDCHHLIIDGWSLDIIRNELSHFYLEESGNKQTTLKTPSQPIDFIEYETEYLESSEYKETEDFWLAQYKDIPPALDLPVDFPRPKSISFHGHRMSIELNEEKVERIRQFNKDNQCTMFASLFTGFVILLNKLTQQNDFVIGVPSAGQVHFGDPNIVTHCVNFLPVRIQISEDETIETLLSKARLTIQDVNDNQQFTFGKLLQKLQNSRSTARLPLLSCNFNLDKVDEGRNFAETEFENLTSYRDAVKYELSFNLRERNNIIIEMDYRTDLVTEKTISKWGYLYIELLDSMMKSTNTKVDNLILSLEKDKQLLNVWNSTSKQFNTTEGSTFIEKFSSLASSQSSDIAVISGKEKLSYEQLEKQSNQLANYFISDLNIQPGDFVGICMHRSTNMLVGLLAILKAGAAYVPLDPDYPIDRLLFMLESTQAKALVTENTLKTLLAGYSCPSICLDGDTKIYSHLSSNTPSVISNQNSTAYVIFTSGSTGKPKGVQVHHGAMTNFLNSMAENPGLCSEDKLLAVTTLSFDISVLELYLPLLVGGTTVIASHDQTIDGRELNALIENENITVMQATPSTWRLLLTSEWKGKKDLKALCGGESLPKDLVEQLLSRVESLWNMYGPTETTVWSTCYRITDTTSPILIGKPIANTQCHVLDNNLQPAPIGITGELYIGGAGVSLGYLGRDDLTQERFITDPFSNDPTARLYRTGDLVRWQQNGELEYFNRIDNQVKVRGFRIELGEIESILSQHNHIQECIVIVREDQPGDQRLVAYVVLRPGIGFSNSDLQSHLSSNLPQYMVPKHIVTLDELPLTPNGKIDKNSLPAPTKSITESSCDEPTTENEIYLATLWGELLHDDAPIYKDDNFFDIGGHSLLAAQMSVRIRNEKNIDIPIMNFITNTLEQISSSYLECANISETKNAKTVEKQKSFFSSIKDKLISNKK